MICHHRHACMSVWVSACFFLKLPVSRCVKYTGCWPSPMLAFSDCTGEHRAWHSQNCCSNARPLFSASPILRPLLTDGAGMACCPMHCLFFLLVFWGQGISVQCHGDHANMLNPASSSVVAGPTGTVHVEVMQGNFKS